MTSRERARHACPLFALHEQHPRQPCVHCDRIERLLDAHAAEAVAAERERYRDLREAAWDWYVTHYEGPHQGSAYERLAVQVRRGEEA